MADKEDLDLDVKPAAGKQKLVIIVAAVALLMALGGAGITFWLISGDKEETAEGAAVVAVPAAHYMALDNMVVNFAQRGPARFLQVEMQLMAHDPAAFRVIEQHMPVIRNDLLVLLGSISYEEASSREGKERLNQAILETINGIVQERSNLAGIQAVYFTNFVMQ